MGSHGRECCTRHTCLVGHHFKLGIISIGLSPANEVTWGIGVNNLIFCDDWHKIGGDIDSIGQICLLLTGNLVTNLKPYGSWVLAAVFTTVPKLNLYMFSVECLLHTVQKPWKLGSQKYHTWCRFVMSWLLCWLLQYNFEFCAVICDVIRLVSHACIS